VREYRAGAPGSRFKARTVVLFSVLAVAPVLLVYYFSLQFLNRGIDSWFELEVSQGLKDTRELSRAALDVRVREFLQNTEAVAHNLSGTRTSIWWRRWSASGAPAARPNSPCVGPQTRILATSSDRPMDAMPAPATDEMMLQVRRGRPVREPGHRFGRACT
jgi:nitrogen fixation/metabolism regulation signal transduction histidine kinase